MSDSPTFRSRRRPAPTPAPPRAPATKPAAPDANGLFDFEPAAPTALPAQAATATGAPVGIPLTDRPRQRINETLAVALMSIVALAPIPLGSNRPVFWLIWAAAIYAIAAAYSFFSARHQFALRVPPWRIPLLSMAALAFLLYAAFQLVPSAWLFPDSVALAGGTRISAAKSATFLALIRWSSYALFFFLMLQTTANRSRARKLAWVTFLIVFAHASYGLLSFRYFDGAFPWGARTNAVDVVTGTFVNRNSFATFLGMGAILGFALLLHDLRRGNSGKFRFAGLMSAHVLTSALAWICLAIILAALMATASRMGIMATFAGLFLVTVLTANKAQFRWSLPIGLGAVFIAFVLLAGIIVVFGQPAIERAIFTLGGKDGRYELFIQVAEMIRDRPWLGFGLDSFPVAFEQYHHPPVTPDLVWNRTHSTYLALWVEMGLIFGSLPVLIAILFAIRQARVVLGAPRDFVLAIAGLGVLALVGLHSMVDFSLEMAANVYLFLTIMALGYSSRMDRAGSSANGSDT